MTLTDAERPADAMERLRSRFPHTLELRFEPEGAAAGPDLSYTERVSGRGDLDVCCGFVEHVRGRAAAGAEVDVLRSAVEDLRRDAAERRGAAALRADRREAGAAAVVLVPTPVGPAAVRRLPDRSSSGLALRGGRVRLHRLTSRAFGPFAGTEEVDFDALAEGGLFLLHGPTGAGKTSVLDAVCFALYGQRARQPAARPSGCAATTPPRGVARRCVCEFSVGARRFEVTRSPAWERPKKRGDGHHDRAGPGHRPGVRRRRRG